MYKAIGVNVDAARVDLCQSSARIVELGRYQDVERQSVLAGSKQLSEVASATFRTLEEKLYASALHFRKFEALLWSIEQASAGLQRKLAQAKRDDEYGRTTDILVQEKARQVHEADMGRLREAFVTVRAQDRSSAVLEIWIASEKALRKLENEVHEGHLAEQIAKKQSPAV